MWIKRQIVMLPFDVSKRYNCTEGLIVKCIKSWTPIGNSPREVNKLTISRNCSKGVLDCYEAQHLLIISDEEITHNDWVLLPNNEIHKMSPTDMIHYLASQSKATKKIIATTDTSLGLPQPSQQFIEKYIEEYNKGNQIEEIFIEYIQELSIDLDGQLIEEAYLKVNFDNTISIRSKINWSVEEVEEILRKCAFHFINNPPSNSENILQVSNQWIKENL